jgi:hypothetical protein
MLPPWQRLAGGRGVLVAAFAASVAVVAAAQSHARAIRQVISSSTHQQSHFEQLLHDVDHAVIADGRPTRWRCSTDASCLKWRRAEGASLHCRHSAPPT